MFQAIRDRLNNNEEGFTLIELLVVVIIIGILAAIAIPTFLNQRQNGWESAAQSDLRNASVALEEYFTENGTYAGTPAFSFTTRTTDGVSVAPVGAPTATTACLGADHANLGATGPSVDFVFDTADGRIVAGATC